jgi:two-component system, NarL family, invasion response regulator UvrY
MDKIKVVITDDHPLVREGIKKVITQGTMDISIQGEASTGADLMKMIENELPDVVILDISMPDKNGLDVLKTIKTMHPMLPVLILSMHPEDRFATRAIKAGASGYLTKSSISEELILAIRTVVLQKKRYISAAVAEQLALQMDNSIKSHPHESLSDREYQILCMIASGKKIKEIADELSLSVQTIHTYRSRLKEKMNLNSNVEFARYAIQYNLID